MRPVVSTSLLHVTPALGVPLVTSIIRSILRDNARTSREKLFRPRHNEHSVIIISFAERSPSWEETRDDEGVVVAVVEEEEDDDDDDDDEAGSPFSTTLLLLLLRHTGKCFRPSTQKREVDEGIDLSK